MNPYLNQYRKAQVQTASPEQILIMLYDGAIRFLNQAKVHIQNKDIENSHTNIVKAQRIITEFMSSLDMEVGGDMAKNLFNLYEYLHYRLVQANIKKDIEAIDEVLEHLRSLKETWEEAIKIAQRERQGIPAQEATPQANPYQQQTANQAGAKAANAYGGGYGNSGYNGGGSGYISA